ncbi:MAG TPA: YbhB/YbcL family Raf kinase inhibitor-like protein [Terracidiphilus sp.]|jgi:hypothetical protein|nr:YbhB/YbcL family Raf kinase inhibitor-like protein [Terracidiphilus sp.]
MRSEIHRTSKMCLLLTTTLTASLWVGCHRHSAPAVEADGADSLHLGPSSFTGKRIPAIFTCDGADISPALQWDAPPAGTRSFALILNDRDALMGSFVHWVVFNLPPAARLLPQSFSAQDQLPDGTRQGRNDFDKIGYGGPCPGGHRAHHYSFTLFALDSVLNLAPGATRAQLDEAMKGHVLARGVLVGSYSR